MLARHCYTRSVDDVDLDAASPQPSCQPETVTTGFKGDGDAFDLVSCLLGFLLPSMQQVQQRALVDPEFFQRLTLNARHDTGDQPTRLAHLDYGDQCCILVESYEGSA